MQPRRRRPTPPWERDRQAPVHPVGRTRRRWDRAYDGGTPVGGRLPDRYRRAYDGARTTESGPRLKRQRSAMEGIRRHPLRHGLVGLGIAGAAMPIAMSRQQAAIRTDPSHEQTLTQHGATARISDSLVTRAWAGAVEAAETPVTLRNVSRAAEEATAGTATTASREAKIQENLERHKAYDVPRDLAETIYDLALQEGIDPDVAFGLVRTESAFKSSATSHVGAMGLTQLMPRTAKWLRPGTTTADLRNPEVNLQVGFKYLKQLIKQYDGDTELALLAYNRGPGTVDKILKRGGNPDNGYADMVLRGRSH